MHLKTISTLVAFGMCTFTFGGKENVVNDEISSPKVLIIGIDGIRPDALLTAHTPNLDQLIQDGAWSNHALTDVHTVSGPCWSSILTGVWSPRHGVIDNTFENNHYAKYPHFFALLKEQQPDLITASFIDWLPLDNAMVNDATCDIRLTYDYEDDGDEKMVDEAEYLLKNRDVDVVFFYFADSDTAGHEHGFHPHASGYISEIEEIDQQIGRLLTAVRSRQHYVTEQWLTLITSDHGGTLDGSHGRDIPKHRYVPFIMHGPGVYHHEILPSPATVDVPNTALAHMGIKINPEWELDGRVIPFSPPTGLETNLIVNGDAEHAPGTKDVQLNLVAPGWDDTSAITVLEYGCAEGYPDQESAGPPDRGLCFFAAGAANDCIMSQTISLVGFSQFINDETIVFELSGYLGGFSDQRDFATVTVTFLDSQGGELARTSIGPVTVDDRRNALGSSGDQLTGLLYRKAQGFVPQDSYSARITLELETGSGICDGYADNLSFILSPVTR